MSPVHGNLKWGPTGQPWDIEDAGARAQRCWRRLVGVGSGELVQSNERY